MKTVVSTLHAVLLVKVFYWEGAAAIIKWYGIFRDPDETIKSRPEVSAYSYHKPVFSSIGNGGQP